MAGQKPGFFRVDGHRIAFATAGSGPPLVLPAWWTSNVIEDWKWEGFRRFIEGFGRERQVIWYDRLGCGISDRVRPRETLTPEYEVAVLAALIDHVGLGRVSLFGASCGGCTAVTYAVRNRERVDRIVLYATYASGAEIAAPASRRAMLELVRGAWGLGSRMLADLFVRSEGSGERGSFVAWQRAAASAEIAADLLELIYDTDISEMLPELRQPTLVIHRRDDPAIPLRCGEHVAALAPNSQFVVLNGAAHVPWAGDTDAVLAAAASFLGFARRVPSSETAIDVADLSLREREVLRLIADGLSDAEIATRLVLSPHTVHRHIANILRKLGLHSRAAAAAHAARAGLL